MFSSILSVLDRSVEDYNHEIKIGDQVEGSRPVNDLHLAAENAYAEILEEGGSPFVLGSRGFEEIARSVYCRQDGALYTNDEKAADVAKYVKELFVENPRKSVQNYVDETVEEFK